jgi:hypothetical protein
VSGVNVGPLECSMLSPLLWDKMNNVKSTQDAPRWDCWNCCTGPVTQPKRNETRSDLSRSRGTVQVQVSTVVPPHHHRHCSHSLQSGWRVIDYPACVVLVTCTRSCAGGNLTYWSWVICLSPTNLHNSIFIYLQPVSAWHDARLCSSTTLPSRLPAPDASLFTRTL